MELQNKNEQIARKFFELFDRADLSEFKEFVSPDLIWTPVAKSIPVFRTYNGIDEILNDFVGQGRKNLEGAPRSQINRLLVAGDWAIAEIEGFGKMKNGVDYHNFYCILLEIKNEKVVQVREYMDTGYILNLPH